MRAVMDHLSGRSGGRQPTARRLRAAARGVLAVAPADMEAWAR